MFGQARKIQGTFCEEKLAPKARFDPRSFRWKRSGRSWLLIGCPRGQWTAKGYVTVRGKRQKGRCKVGTRGFKLLVPVRARRCPIGAKRVSK